jgi:hypothetical protein
MEKELKLALNYIEQCGKKRQKLSTFFYEKGSRLNEPGIIPS